MNPDVSWSDRLKLDLDYGFLSRRTQQPPLSHNPRVVLNASGDTVLHELRKELKRCRSFTFSVAFVSPAAIALLKQDLIDFQGEGRIVTSDYLGFNTPAAFAELRSLRQLGLDVRLHNADGFHPKGYVFQDDHSVTAMMGSSNLTPSALLKNHEWNLKVSAALDSDLAAQLEGLLAGQVADSVPITSDWIARYAETYVPPRPEGPRVPRDLSSLTPGFVGDHEDHSEVLPRVGDAVEDAVSAICPNAMQTAALEALKQVREAGEKRAVIISATGTGKTILSALDVREVAPRRLLFVVHREQILDHTIREYRRVLGGDQQDYGKLTGSSKDFGCRYLFATIQTLGKAEVLGEFATDVFDYVIVDEAHRSGGSTYQRVLAHFDPVFMLGMTATPERTDGFNVFELFDHNVPFEIRLNRALEEDMLTPFHYYGIADATLDDGSTVDAETALNRLVAPERVSHLVRALELYGQAGVAPRGLIFCSRTEEARSLSEALNHEQLRGRDLRTTALSGADTVEDRERAVERLEGGELDYILTVDVFNEGVDIPSVNQIVMLRQTQSAIVFVQQLGRGLRKCPGKEYLVVIDFIGNYANNFLIPIALFGDESLNRESLRKSLISAEEAGAMPGLSSVQFDRISQERVLASITETKLDSAARLRSAIIAMAKRVGRAPELWDFMRFESVDPVLLATSRKHYPDLLSAVLKEEMPLSLCADRALRHLSHEVFVARRLHEVLLLRLLLDQSTATIDQISATFEQAGLLASDFHVRSAIATLTLEGFGEGDVSKYDGGIAVLTGDSVALKPEVASQYGRRGTFANAVDDVIRTGIAVIKRRYGGEGGFVPGIQYSRKEVARLLCWPRSWAPTLYGYKVDLMTGPVPACPIFVTLHKSDDVAFSTAYEDELVDPSTMVWYTRSKRRITSGEVVPIVANSARIFVFVKKDDAEGSDFYFLGEATAHGAVETTMADSEGKELPVVRMNLHFSSPIETALFDYFHPTHTG